MITTVMISAQATEKKSSPIPIRRCTNMTRIITSRPSAVAHVTGAPGKRGARRAEPDGVDAVDLVIGADEHRGHPMRRPARKLPISGPLPDTAMPSATRPDQQTHAAPRHPGVVAAPPDPQQDDRDAEQHERDDVVLDPALQAGGAQAPRSERDGFESSHDGSSFRSRPSRGAGRDPGPRTSDLVFPAVPARVARAVQRKRSGSPAAVHGRNTAHRIDRRFG